MYSSWCWQVFPGVSIPPQGRSARSFPCLTYRRRSTTIDHLEKIYTGQGKEHEAEGKAAIAYLYCNYKERDTHTAANLTSSLLRQLADTNAARQCSLHDAIVALYAKYKLKQARPSVEEISIAVETLAGTLKNVFIIVDAVDEIADEERNIFLTQIKGFIQLKGLKVLLMSRPDVYLAGYFGHERDAQITVHATDDDVAAYVQGQIDARKELAVRVRGNLTLGGEIKAGIIRKAEGMWVPRSYYFCVIFP